MKFRILAALAAVSLFLSHMDGFAQATNGATAELKAVTAKIQTKLQAGKTTEADLGDELKEMDALLAKHQGEKTDEVAQILFMKAMIYCQVLENTEKGAALIRQLKRDFPDTKPGQSADGILESIQKQEEAKKIQRSLVEGSQFPGFNEKDLAGQPLSPANYKGKVLLIDFWATWCGPCVRELPIVLKAYEKYHPKGFEIIGISLDKDEHNWISL